MPEWRAGSSSSRDHVGQEPDVPAELSPRARVLIQTPATTAFYKKAGQWITDETHEQYWIRQPQRGYNPPAYEPGADL